MKTKKLFLSLLVVASLALLLDLVFLCCLAIFANEFWRLTTFAVVVAVANAVVVLFGGIYLLVRLVFKKEI